MIWTWLANLLGGPVVKGLLDGYRAKLEAGNTSERIAADLAARELAVEQREKELNAQVVIAEQGRWYTALPRPAFALAVVIFFWKILVWDKVLGLGSTTLPAPEIMQWCGIIVTAYFGGRTLEKIIRILRR